MSLFFFAGRCQLDGPSFFRENGPKVAANSCCCSECRRARQSQQTRRVTAILPNFIHSSLTRDIPPSIDPRASGTRRKEGNGIAASPLIYFFHFIFFLFLRKKTDGIVLGEKLGRRRFHTVGDGARYSNRRRDAKTLEDAVVLTIRVPPMSNKQILRIPRKSYLPNSSKVHCPFH